MCSSESDKIFCRRKSMLRIMTTSNYFEDLPLILEKALTIHKKTEENLKEDIRILKKWFEGQPHLPEIPTDQMITAFIIFNKFNTENVKQKLDMYYTMRSLYPEYFRNKHPLLPHMQENLEKVYSIPLPKATTEGYRVIICRLSDRNTEIFNIYDFFAQLYNVIEVRLHEDHHLGDVLVYDFKGVKFGHLVQTTPSILRNNTAIFKKVFNNKIKQMHILNTMWFVDPVIALSKRLMSRKLGQRIHVHKSMESLKEFISPSILPKDYGGEESSLEELSALWNQKFTDYNERFDKLANIRVDESLRPK
ncbi:hypothetical protein JTB14_020817 [Gonioctena quinquepunctata]|nr:hypothetical protein JTB14_020817 [Gonioctena quinquepunctata]